MTFVIEEIVGNLDSDGAVGGRGRGSAGSGHRAQRCSARIRSSRSRALYGLEHASSLLFYAGLGLAAAGRLGGLHRFTARRAGPVQAFPEFCRAMGAAGPRRAGHRRAGGAVALRFLGSKGVTGGGYETLSKALLGQIGFRVLLALCALELVATVACYSSGGAGGIFGPALFIGAMLGGAVGLVDVAAMGQSGSELGAFALVGMGAVFAGVIRAPITSVLDHLRDDRRSMG